MQLEFSKYQSELFHRFAELGRHAARNAARHDAEGTFDRETWMLLAEAGLWRIPVPKSLGGLGGTWSDCAAAMEGVATTAEDLGFLVTMLGHIGSLRIILEEGTPEQKERWLEPVMRGDVGVTAMTEKTGGSDLARMQVAAHSEETGWRLNGEKVHITNAPIASLGMIAGRIPSLGEKRDITLFFLDLDQDGIALGETEDNLGIRTSPTANIRFTNARIDPINIIGAPGDGLRILYRIISFERALYGIMASGLIENMLGKSMERVESRKAFNRPLADYQYVQGRITDMKIASVVCRLMTYAGLEQLGKETEDASITCSVGKFLAGEKLLEAAEHMVQLHGHLGFMNNDLSRQLRDAVGMRIAGGTSDIQKINIFNQMRRQVSVARQAQFHQEAAE
ncbi:acyl-CoA dehydrogenase family protein [Roseibium litorale]|uniref:Acyl-CoA/acyl-ACP dehydrogenase n=1 Tax=Roseibium litorale TaxID=2803841 RepID=A0ABR9CKE5_9HYPH|nr:acyl-CoA dehydrogenase family protein [Roseibium litorale]MBD8891317.1 acyl-CoA/acyl-ACP dehydrogenase [Roseibium litorale]